MSNAVFPTFPGLMFDTTRTPVWSTTVKAAVSQREYRSANASYPLYRYKLQYEFLRQGRSGYTEMEQLAGFFNARQGSFDSFLFLDPDDNQVTNQLTGLGNGVDTTAQLVRTFGGYSEPVFDPIYASVFTAGYGGTARANYLRNSQVFSAGYWTPNNSTLADNATTAPDGTGTGGVLTRTAPGNHYLSASFTTTFTPSNQFVFSIWLKAGTLTGDVQLRIRDGSDVEFGSATVQPTSTWQRYYVATTMGAGAAPNVVVYVDPNNNAGAAGDTLYVWGGQLENQLAPSAGYIKTGTVIYYPTVDLTKGLVTFSAPPAPGAQITWTGSYYRRVRFVQDQLEFNKFMRALWSLKTVELQSVKP